MDGHNPDQDTSFSGVLKRVISPISFSKKNEKRIGIPVNLKGAYVGVYLLTRQEYTEVL
jgi:hypothetical protein